MRLNGLYDHAGNTFYDTERKRIMQEAVIPIYFVQKPLDLTVSVLPWQDNIVQPSF